MPKTISFETRLQVQQIFSYFKNITFRICFISHDKLSTEKLKKNLLKRTIEFMSHYKKLDSALYYPCMFLNLSPFLFKFYQLHFLHTCTWKQRYLLRIIFKCPRKIFALNKGIFRLHNFVLFAAIIYSIIHGTFYFSFDFFQV